VAEPTPAQQRAAEARRRKAAVAAGGTGLAVGVTAKQAADAAAKVPPVAARAAAASTILAALVGFYLDQQRRTEAWITTQLGPRGAPADDVARVIAEEAERETAFAEKQAARLSAQIGLALADPDQSKREAKVRALMAQEETYARQRSMAMAARAFAAIERVVLHDTSPLGAFWRLDPTVIEHTAGCLFMGGRFWPWQVLDRVHPPRHHGCPCRLLGYGEAVHEGLMAAGDVMDVKAAVRRAAIVVMEGVVVLDEPQDAFAMVQEAELLTPATQAQLVSIYGLTG
jgi:hypothetical protein